MNLKALVTTILLGTSTLAVAAPYARPPIREPRDHRPTRVIPRAQWSHLASGQLVRGRDVIHVDARRVDQLKLAQVGPGRLFIDKLVVSFGNGRTQTFHVNRWAARGGDVIVDVKGQRTITQVAVYGRGTSNGFRAGAAFQLLAL